MFNWNLREKREMMSNEDKTIAKPADQTLGGEGLSEETIRFVDLWHSDTSWAIEELGGHYETIISELIKAAGIPWTKESGERWMNEEGQVPYKCNCG